MIVEDQERTIAFLKAPGTHGTRGPVEVIATHISMVFLAGDRAFKLKRAVKLPYVDFSTPWIRVAACEREVALNAPTAPGLYLGVRQIFEGADGRLSFDGPGEVVDAVVEMVRFDQEALFDRLAASGRLTPALMTELARRIAAFHRDAPVVHAGGGAANISNVLDINAAGFATSTVFSAEETAALDQRFRTALARHAALLDDRERAGEVRRCHGDLHLRNICLFKGQPRLFDCIDFNDTIATVDVLYDLAFLLMDLWHRGHPEFASLVANRYLDDTGEDPGMALLPFLMALRAAVRAHVTATMAEDPGRDRDGLSESAKGYRDLALALLVPRPPVLVAIGGFSGSGKTTVAEALAPSLGAPPGARVVESDRTRKAMFGVRAEDRLGPEAYAPAVSDTIYERLGIRAEGLLQAGCAVVVDAVFDVPERRMAIADVARAAGVPFAGVWLDADPETLRHRVRARSGGPSDATPAVLDAQLARGAGAMEWTRIDADGTVAAAVAAIAACLPRAARPSGA